MYIYNTYIYIYIYYKSVIYIIYMLYICLCKHTTHKLICKIYKYFTFVTTHALGQMCSYTLLVLMNQSTNQQTKGEA